MTRTTWLQIGCGLALSMAAAVAAQTPQTPQTPTFRSNVEIVELDVSVTRAGAPVHGLTAADFIVTDNGVTQEITSATLDQLPLSVTMALDTSSSVSGDRLIHLVQAGNVLTGALHPDDRAALLTFSHAVNLRVPMTGDMTTIRTALARMKAGGATALRDAIQMALELRPHDGTRPLLLLFTDGVDTSSWLTEDQALEAVRRAGIVIHAVNIGGGAFLDQVVDAAGGRTWSATSDRDLHELFTRALDEMRARYLLAFTPRESGKPGWHELKVRLKNGRADITARPGYIVSGSSPRP